MRTILLIALFGAAGAVSRYSLSGWVQNASRGDFPFGTMAVNLLGCFLLGVIFQFGQTSTAIPQEWRQGISIGFLGALTTFSTFSFETFQKIEAGSWGAALANMAVSLVLGLAAVWAGLTLARFLWGGA